jgi:hypothetical protein
VKSKWCYCNFESILREITKGFLVSNGSSLGAIKMDNFNGVIVISPFYYSLIENEIDRSTIVPALCKGETLAFFYT